MPVSARATPGSMKEPSGYTGLAVSKFSLYVDEGSPATERPCEMRLSIQLNQADESSSLTKPVKVGCPDSSTGAP